jgi:hypothetical protein
LANAGGYDIEVSMQAKGGWTLGDHAGSTETIEMIRGQSWHYVILQEQSVIPANPADREAHMYPAVRDLNAEIQDSGGETFLFLTWGRQGGIPELGYVNFSEMQDALTEGYLGIADELDILVAPVGEAWRYFVERGSGSELWQPDGSHPSKSGSYLAACVFYAVMFNQSPEGLMYTAGLEGDIAEMYQSIAFQTVDHAQEMWNIK